MSYATKPAFFPINPTHFAAMLCNSFRSDILAQPWDDLKRVHNPNEMWLKWKTLFVEVSDVHAPLRSKRVRGSNSPWITTELKKMMHLRDRLKTKAIRSGEAIDWI